MLLASLWRDMFDPGYLVSNPWLLIAAAFQIWMFVDAIRRGEWIWAVCIFVFSVISALLYFFMVYRAQGAASGGGGSIAFELPGAKGRARLRQIQDRIYHLDHARDHLDLADLYFQDGKYAKAELSYRESLKRDPSDTDAIAHLGQCLLRLKRPAEARPLLEQALSMDPRHDYGHTLMALAETQTALGETDAALRSWQQVLANNSYARAKIQYAELLLARGDAGTARTLAREVIDDDRFAPRFQRGRDRHWVKRAASLVR